jgi:hypothetical protein
MRPGAITVLTAGLAVVVAAFFGARLHDHERCDDARGEVFEAALRKQGAPRDAVARIRESCRGTAARVAVAGALHAQGRDDEAAPLAREATEEEPDNAAAWRALAETAQTPAEARAAAERFTELDPLGARSLNRSAGRSTR